MSTPAGWYPDPADPSRTRWWTGSAWSDAPESAADPVSAPAAQTPAHQAAPAYPAASSYPSAPAYPSGPAAPRGAPAGVKTDTVWIWLAIVAGTLPFLTVLLIDWDGYIETMARMSAGATSDVAGIGRFMGSILLVSLLGYIGLGASILFSWLDWRELKRRGIPRPFHWGFAFFALLISIGVYVIGRTVVLRRDAGKGHLVPLWVWIIATVLGFVVIFGWMFVFMNQLMTAIVPTLPN